MKVTICLLCLKQVDEENLSTSEETGEVPLLTKFLKFVKNYLQVAQLPSSEQLWRITGSGGNDGFCEKCELSVINPIITVYAQLLSTQLRLSWEVEQLEKVLKQSTSSMKLDLLTDKLGVSELKNFRRSLQENCQLKRKEMLPQVLVERLIMIPETVELTQNEDEPDVKVETGSTFENDVDCDEDDVFDPLDVDTYRSLHSDGHPSEDHKFGNFTNKLDSSNEIGIHLEHNTLKMDILEPTPFLGKIDDADEVIDPTFSPDDDIKKAVKNGQVGGKRQFPCPKCSKIFATHVRMKNHGYYAHSGRRYRCIQCKSCFKSKAHLVQHVTSIHKPEPRTCQHCGKFCKSIKALKMHMFWMHRDPIKQPKCPKCGRSFTHQHNLRRHLPICAGKKSSSTAPPKIKTGVIKKTV